MVQKKVTIEYLCEICGTSYETPNRALSCEMIDATHKCLLCGAEQIQPNFKEMLHAVGVPTPHTPLKGKKSCICKKCTLRAGHNAEMVIV